MNKDEVKIILVMGKSGSGKQPRIDCLAAEFKFYQLSTGNLFRERISLYNNCHYQGNINEVWDVSANDFKSDEAIIQLLKNNSKDLDSVVKDSNYSPVILGMKAKYFVENGLFCPDTLTCDIFKNAYDTYFNAPLETCGSERKGLILDGFPRTVAQVDYLVNLLASHQMKVDFILEVSLDDETIVKRTTGRRICPKCSKVYHLLFTPPKNGKYCKVCKVDPPPSPKGSASIIVPQFIHAPVNPENISNSMSLLPALDGTIRSESRSPVPTFSPTFSPSPIPPFVGNCNQNLSKNGCTNNSLTAHQISSISPLSPTSSTTFVFPSSSSSSSSSEESSFDPYIVEVKMRADDSKEELLRKRLKEYEEKGQPSLDRLRSIYNVPVVTVTGNLPDPSKDAVKANVLSAISVLFK